MKRILFTLVSLLLAGGLCAQQNDSLLFLPEQLFQQEADEQWLEDHYQQLQELAENPVNLHREDLKILVELQLLSELQLFYLRAYLQNHRQLNSIYELEFIDGFSSEDVQRLKAFVEVKPLKHSSGQSIGKRKILYGQVNVSSNYSTESADTSRLGSRSGMKISGSLKLGRIWQAGFLGEKDPGEQILFTPKQQGLDHYAGFLRYLSPSGAWQCIAGNYKLVTGQGAGYSSASMNFISMDQPFAVKRFHRGFRPYAGTEENNQLQGAALSYQNPILEAGLYLSSHHRDGILDSNQSVTSLTSSGNHSDSIAYARRKNIREHRAGAYLLLKFKTIYLGFHADLQMFPAALLSKQAVQLPANTPFLTSSADYQFPLRRAHFFGEVALLPNGYLQQIHGVEYNPVSSLQIGMKYQLAGSRPVATSLSDKQLQAVTGDRSLMLGLGWSASRSLRVSFSGEWQQRRLHDSTLDAPSSQSGQQLRISYTPARNSLLFIQLRRNLRETAAADDPYFSFPEQARSAYQLRLQAQHALNESISLLLRFDQQSVYLAGNQPLSGSLLIQGVQWNYQNMLVLHFRYLLFQTDSYETAYRVTETDLPGYYSGASLSGRGNRYYIMVKYQAGSNWNLAFKWSQTLYLSGYTSISADAETPEFATGEFRIMLAYRINPREKGNLD